MSGGKKNLVRGPVVAVALLTALLLPRSAGAAGGENAMGAAPASTLSVAMTLYIQGVTLGGVDLTSTIGPDGYRAVSHLKSEGIVTLLWKETIQATVSGAMGPERLRPSLYDSFAIKPDGSKEQTSLTYSGEGAPKLFVDPPYSDRVRIVVPEKDQSESLDPLSALVQLVAGGCGRQVKVFDGRRAYAIAVARGRATGIRMDNGLYAGPGQECIISYRQISGADQEVLEEKSSLPTVHALVASFTGSGTGQVFHVPLRLWADTQYGRVAAVATSVTLDGMKLGGS